MKSANATSVRVIPGTRFGVIEHRSSGSDPLLPARLGGPYRTWNDAQIEAARDLGWAAAGEIEGTDSAGQPVVITMMERRALDPQVEIS